MQIELVVALISGVIALLAAGLASWGQMKAAQVSGQLESLRLAEQRRFEKETTVARYREPLAQEGEVPARQRPERDGGSGIPLAHARCAAQPGTSLRS